MRIHVNMLCVLYFSVEIQCETHYLLAESCFHTLILLRLQGGVVVGFLENIQLLTC